MNDTMRLVVCQIASHLFAETRRDSKMTSYKLTWEKWVGWRSLKEINPFWCEINPILEFLGKIFVAWYKYRTICTCRSAVSSYHDLVEEIKFRAQPKSICNIRNFQCQTSKPKYTFIRDVQTVLNLIKEK